MLMTLLTRHLSGPEYNPANSPESASSASLTTDRIARNG
jgi:hypothetical protein